uniref:Uncharacterized protein n=1 Tax=Arundo donax TaxID=35708 RepID=A0A0A9DUQ1_ARUDO
MEGKRAWRPRSTASGTTTEKNSSTSAEDVAATHRHRLLGPGAVVEPTAGPWLFIPPAEPRRP